MDASLGWEVRNEKCDYRIPYPQLSKDEEEVLCSVASRFADESRSHSFDNEKEARTAISQALLAVLEDRGLEADAQQISYLAQAAYSHIRGFSFLDFLLSDDSVEEIACIGIHAPSYVYLRAKGWKKTNGYFVSQEHFIHVANKIARNLGRRLSSQTPRLNAVLPDGSRLHASIPPISSCEMTIRKFTQKPLTCGELVSFKTATPGAFAFLSLAMQSDSSLVVSGNTSSGKTTLLSLLLCFAPLNERILIIEETPEIRLPHPHQVRLLPTEGEGMADLVHDSLRMRPDRVVLGEARTHEESRAWMESVLSGQARGAYSTYHAQSARETLRRLRSAGIDDEDLRSIDYIVSARRMAKYDAKNRRMAEQRKITGIHSLGASRSQEPIPIFDYSIARGLAPNKKSLPFQLGLLALRLGIGKTEIMAEYARRERLFEGFSRKLPLFDSEVSQFQGFAYGIGK